MPQIKRDNFNGATIVMSIYTHDYPQSLLITFVTFDKRFSLTPETYQSMKTLANINGMLMLANAIKKQFNDPSTGSILVEDLWKFIDQFTDAAEIEAGIKSAPAMPYLQQLGRGQRLQVGTKIIVHGTLHTEIVAIKGDEYYFADREGKVWHAGIDEIKIDND